MGTVIVLLVSLLVPDHAPISYSEEVENLSLCWAMAKELAAHAQENTIAHGGSIRVGCEIRKPLAKDAKKE